MNQPNIERKTQLAHWLVGQNTASKARMIKQLVEALLFEQIVPYHYTNGNFWFAVGDTRYIARGQISSFGRIRLDATYIKQIAPFKTATIDLPTLVNALPASAATKGQLLNELSQTIGFCEWNAAHLTRPESRRSFDYPALESAILEGHPYHPCFKARTGFSLADHANYSPEASRYFKLHWLAIKRTFLASNLPTEEDCFWQQELGDKTLHVLQQRLKALSPHSQEYGLLPIHPWQRNALGAALLHPINTKDIIDLGECGDSYQATISVRTLLNITSPQKAHVKLPMNMVNTSSLRTIEPHSVTTSPAISNWLDTLIKQDSWYQEKQHLAIQHEYAGIVVRPPSTDASSEHWASQLAPSLSVIFRNSQPLQETHSHALPFAALSLIEQDGLPFIDPWINKYGCETWLNQLIEVTVIPVWHLLVKHGIAVEAHAQNMILRHQKGWPTSVVLRDFHESVEYVEDYLAQPELKPDFCELHPDYVDAPDNQYYWMSEVDALRELLVDTLFVYNLTDVATLMQRFYHYEEAQFWQQVTRALSDYEKTAQSWRSRIQKIDLLAPKVQTESLLAKKLSGQGTQEFHHTIPNPLHPL
ncbi:IucA/IucC family protein [Alteromonas sp. CI.11.F.A3]|uniref:IucA/IucC family protein n=1 Tax=Alteromonas sp. CI.11.F.A3 TaxID=3079555 RepID=UPI0029424B3F|nr:IucA/IucC family protein [Alteromonas sp. CI.11.F.A3]WOI38323.1 IucA/IucC family protein [Alteromonas sp. CI.11.F.A3]